MLLYRRKGVRVNRFSRLCGIRPGKTREKKRGLAPLPSQALIVSRSCRQRPGCATPCPRPGRARHSPGAAPRDCRYTAAGNACSIGASPPRTDRSPAPAGSRRSAAGPRPPRPKGRSPLFAVVLVHAVYQPVQQRLHGRRTVPGVDGEARTIRSLPSTRSKMPCTSSRRAQPNTGPVPLAGPAGHAGQDLPVVKPDRLRLRAQPLQLLPKWPQQRGGVPLFPGLPIRMRIFTASPPLSCLSRYFTGNAPVRQWGQAGADRPGLSQLSSSSPSSRWSSTAVWARVAEP